MIVSEQCVLVDIQRTIQVTPSFFFFFFGFLRQFFYEALTILELFRQGWIWTQRFACLCWDMLGCHHCPALSTYFLTQNVSLGPGTHQRSVRPRSHSFSPCSPFPMGSRKQTQTSTLSTKLSPKPCLCVHLITKKTLIIFFFKCCPKVWLNQIQGELEQDSS